MHLQEEFRVIYAFASALWGFPYYIPTEGKHSGFYSMLDASCQDNFADAPFLPSAW